MSSDYPLSKLKLEFYVLTMLPQKSFSSQYEMGIFFLFISELHMRLTKIITINFVSVLYGTLYIRMLVILYSMYVFCVQRFFLCFQNPYRIVYTQYQSPHSILYTTLLSHLMILYNVHMFEHCHALNNITVYFLWNCKMKKKNEGLQNIRQGEDA